MAFRDGLVGKKTGVGGYGADAFESPEERGQASDAFVRQLRGILRRIKRIKRIDTFDTLAASTEQEIESKIWYAKGGAREREEIPGVYVDYARKLEN